MDVAVLGPILVNGEPSGLAHRDRVVLAALVTHAGLAVSKDALGDALWGDAVPDSATKVVQGCVFRLRKVLGRGAIETTSGGYALRLHADSVDSRRFELLVAQARLRLTEAEPDRAAYLADQALALWRGAPLAELENWEPGRLEAQRLSELRLDVQEVRTEAALALDRHQEVMAEALALAEQEPLRERRWELAALAQYRSGRQSDALATVRRAKALLVRELGLDPGPRLIDLERAILNQDPSLTNERVPTAAVDLGCPYPGLLPFTVEDEASFFGRETDVASCLDRLDAAGVVAVVGPSGSGKSSLVRAGVAAALQRDGRAVVVVTPGQHPAESLSSLPSGSAVRQLVVVVDQCEEGLAEDVDPGERAHWVRAMVEHARKGELVLALRSDRVGALAEFAELSRLVERGLYLLGPMSETDLRAAVEGPAAQAGLRLEPGLSDLVIRDVRGEPGALPLLSHVLRQTWMRREGATLTVDGYHACGGVRQALAQSADGVYEHLDPGGRLALRELMLRLVTVAPDGEPMRSPMRRSQLDADTRTGGLVEMLVAARLVSIDDQSVEIAHEALAREWPRLRAWLDEDVEGQQILRHLAVAADTWDAMGRPDSELYRGIRLERARQWHAGASATLSPVEVEFLAASETAAQVERRTAAEQLSRQRRSNRRLRALLAVAATLAVVAALLGSQASASARRAQTQALAADARRVGAEALTAPEPDTSLLLAAAGMRLEHNSDAAKANLAAALTRSPMLAHVVHTPPAGALAVNPRTGEVAASLAGGGVNLYDGRTLRETAHAVTGGGNAATYSPDGSLLVTPGTAHDVNLPSDATPVNLLEASGAPSPMRLGGIPSGAWLLWSGAFSADGRRLAAPLARGTAGRIDLTVWATNNPGAPIAVLRPDNAHMTALALSADGRTLYTTGDYYLRVYDVATGRQRTIRTGPQLGVAPLPFHDQAWTPQVLLSPDGRTLALTAENEVALLDPATLKLKARLGANGRIGSMAFSADSRRLVVTDGGVTVWDLVGKAPVHVSPSPDGDRPRPTPLFRSQTWTGDVAALSPDGTLVYAVSASGRLLAWDLTGASGFVTRGPAAPLHNDMLAAQVSGNGKQVAYLTNIFARIDVRDVATGRVIEGTFPGGGNDNGGMLAWRPDGRAVLEVSGDYYVEVRDPSNGSLLLRHAFSDGVSAAQYLSNGALVIGTNRGTVQVVDARSLQMKAAPLQPVVAGRVVALAFDPAEDAVAVESDSQRVLVDDRTLRPLRRLPYQTFFAPDGSTQAVIDSNGAVGFQTDHGAAWVSTPDPSHAYGSGASAYSHDSTWFASSRDGEVGLWNARTGTFVGSVPVSGTVSVGFTSDDSTLVIAGLDGSVQTWNLRPSAWIRAACTIAGRDLTAQEWSIVLQEQPVQHVCAGT